jgi:hypothetical protein
MRLPTVALRVLLGRREERMLDACLASARRARSQDICAMFSVRDGGSVIFPLVFPMLLL